MELHQWRIRSGAIHLHLNTGLEEILLHGYDGEPAIKARQGGNLAANNLCHVGRLLVFFEWYLVSQAMPDRVGDWQLYRLIGLFLANLVFTAVLAAIALLYFWVRFAKSLPDLQGWHLQEPESEFCAVDATSEYTLENYLEQEAKVFKALDSLDT